MARRGLSRLTVEVPEALHRRAKVRAAELGTDIRVLVIEGLVWVLSHRPKPRAGRDGR